MFRIAIAAALALLASDSGTPLPLNAPGRAVAESDGSLRFGWPGAYFEGRFRGTAVSLKVENAADHLRVMIDGKEAARITAPGTAPMTLDGLAPGEHVVRLEKLTESQSGSTRFLGFRADGEALSPKPRARRIEFIGDSHTVGYGNTSPVRQCDGKRVHDTTDTQQAFGPVLARRLDADYRVVAYSGYGIVRNYDGHKPGESLPFLYPRAIPGEPAAAPADGWRPQLIVVNLGTNDFSTPLHAGEAWADQPALRAAWRARYVEFLRMLIARQPQARFVLMGADNFFEDVAAVAAAVDAGSGTRVATLRTGPLELTGCDWHPSLKDHVAMADRLQAEIEKLRIYMD